MANSQRWSFKNLPERFCSIAPKTSTSNSQQMADVHSFCERSSIWCGQSFMTENSALCKPSGFSKIKSVMKYTHKKPVLEKDTGSLFFFFFCGLSKINFSERSLSNCNQMCMTCIRQKIVALINRINRINLARTFCHEGYFLFLFFLLLILSCIPKLEFQSATGWEG